MNSLASLFAVFLTFLFQSNALPATCTDGARSAVAFVPRGGAAAIGRRRGRSKSKDITEDKSEDENSTIPEMEGDGEAGIESEEEFSSSFDIEEVSKQLREEEVAEIKQSQQFLKKQQQRRELDKTFLDKGITAFIEFFENLFSWKVIDV
mmetsp:Transcript_20188/g.32724  ORF Transcript_20188/g.32724 Transcript_20188/m.32724 type:complete len:150 (+) Transcript_20188:86-535(+)|eukprot:CAMPEP_0196130466 /NCGR_PEP_ID=MMETSP0910-20130528/824_1 /TAXON_ID=49265 /ORGANISM="Thalassiosira rotula, Strain GSO102" /LENGTH=149 /DNA_ID=CAMNT_0041389773 /DNA_START=94 /DNA_END=543 /DNA_ORIENTATION=-